MASRKKGVQILFPLESADAFQKAVDESDKFLAVIDVYQSWTGPTAVMEPVFRRIKMEKERVPARAAGARTHARARERERERREHEQSQRARRAGPLAPPLPTRTQTQTRMLAPSDFGRGHTPLGPLARAAVRAGSHSRSAAR